MPNEKDTTKKKRTGTYSSMNDWAKDSQLLLANATTCGDIRIRLATVGYTDEKFKQGQALLEEALGMIREQKKQWGERYGANEALKKTETTAFNRYMTAVKFARIVLGDRKDARAAMMIDGTRNQSLSGRMAQIDAFYGNLLANADAVTAMAEYGYTRASIEQDYALTRELSEAYQNARKEAGEATGATKARDKKIDEAARWISNLRSAAKIVFRDDPDKLKILGIM